MGLNRLMVCLTVCWMTTISTVYAQAAESNPSESQLDSSKSLDERLDFVNKLIEESHQTNSKQTKVILILADGVRWDYVNDPNLTAFDRMRKRGVKASYVQPIFPSYSYPNWYTIVTGLYAENHGMVQNFMYDEKENKTFLMYPHPDAGLPFWWNEAEPIWVTAEKNGIKTGMYWWDGCQIEIRGSKPTACVEYRSYWSWPDPKIDTINQLESILDHFGKNELQFALVYYEAIDAIGHAWGPESKERKDAMKDLDQIMGNLLDSIDERNMTDEVAVVLVSDHGMIQINKSEVNKIDLDSILDENDIDRMLERGPITALYPKVDKKQKVLEDLKKANVKGMRFYAKEDMPSQYHYKNNQRIGPIILVAEKGYFIRGLRGAGKTIPAWDIIYTGHHGYNPYATEEMRAIMFAYGPKLKQSYVGAPIMMTDHYNLLCYLLGLKPNANNGSWKRVADLVAEKSASQTQNSFSASPGRLSIAALVFTTICLTLIRWRLVCSIL